MAVAGAFANGGFILRGEEGDAYEGERACNERRRTILGPSRSEHV